MKSAAGFIAAILISVSLTACSAGAKRIAMESQGTKSDIFRERSDGDSIPAGYGDVVIKANIKTHLEDYYIAESGASAHGKPNYPFLVNIGGQAAVWSAPGVVDTKPAHDPDGRTSRDPEAREGMKYVLEKKVRVPAGSHTLVFGLPEEDYFIGTKITVKSGETAVLEYKPVYRYKTVPARIPTFLNGIAYFDVYVNGSKSTTMN